MPASGDDQERLITEDLINWQYQAQNEPLIRLAYQAHQELDELAAALDVLNQLLADPQCDVEAASDAVVAVMRLGTVFAVHALGIVIRDPQGLSLDSVPSPSAN
jgi:hypothetical protein